MALILSAANKSFMLIISMLNVVRPSVMAPIKIVSFMAVKKRIIHTIINFIVVKSYKTIRLLFGNCKPFIYLFYTL